MDSCSYWPICRWNNGFCWRICGSLPFTCALGIGDGLCASMDWLCSAPLPFFRLSTELLSRSQWILGLLLLLRKKPSPLELQKGLGLSNMAPILSFAFFKERLQYYLV